jgi:hypothetical protein
MWIWISTGLYIKFQYLNQGVQGEDCYSHWTIWHKQFYNHFWRVCLQVGGPRESSHRHGHYSHYDQYLQNLHIPIVWFCSILKAPIPLQNILVFCSTMSKALRSSREVVSEHLRAHCITFSLSESSWKPCQDQSSYLELLSCSVITSNPFYILLINTKA